MRPRRTRLVAWAAVAGWILVACSEGPTQTGSPPPSDKLDETVLAALQGPDPIDVIILGRTQLALDSDGLDDHIRTVGSAPRSMARTDAVSRLKATATSEQAPILAALAGSALVRPLWMANAISARVSRATLEQLVELEEVRYVYGSPANPGDFTASIPFVGLTGVEAPFELGDKPVAWNLEEIRAPEAWAESTGEGSLIALIDIGFNTAHPDLTGALWVNPNEVPGNGVDDDGNGYVDDVHGYDLARASPNVFAGGDHGPFVAGILVGDGTQGTVLGVAPGRRGSIADHRDGRRLGLGHGIRVRGWRRCGKHELQHPEPGQPARLLAPGG